MTPDPIRAAAQGVADLRELFAGPWRRGISQIHTARPGAEDSTTAGRVWAWFVGAGPGADGQGRHDAAEAGR